MPDKEWFAEPKAEHPYAGQSRLSKTHHGDKDSRDSRRSLPPWFVGTSQKKSSPSTKQRRRTSVGIEGPLGIIIEDKSNSTDEAPAPAMLPHIVAAKLCAIYNDNNNEGNNEGN